MRYAIFSDIHGNRPAWDAVLADMRALEVDVFVCLGDIVGYGPKPQEVLDGIRSVTSNFVLGNHDAAAVGILDASIFNDQAREVIEWTRNQLNEESISFLQEMPLVIEDEDILFVHAEMEEPGRFLYIDSEEEARANFRAVRRKVTFVGHTHNPCIFVENPDGSVQRLPDDDGILEDDSRYIVNVGSVGEPRNPEDIRARYVIYDNDTRAVAFRRIEFDVEAYRAELARSGLGVTPYFLQVVDHYQEALAQSQMAGAGHAMMVDMQSSGISPVKLSKARRQIVVPPPSARMSRPKPKVSTPPPRKRSPAVAASLITLLLAAAIGAVFWFNRGEPPTEELVVESVERVITPGEDDPEEKEPGGSGPPDGSIASMVTAEAGGESPARQPPLNMPADGPLGYWSFDKADAAMEKPAMFLMTAGENTGPLIDPVPWTGAKNAGAAIGGSWQEEKASDWFDLAADRSFTFECWYSAAPTDRNIEFIAGNRTNTGDGFRGWHLIRGASDPGAFLFVYDPGGHRASVELSISGDTLFDEKPHHLAVVWDHQGGSRDNEGVVRMFVDGEEQGAVPIPHEVIPPEPAGKKFCLGDRLTDQDNLFRGTLDEARFSAEALAPVKFLSAVGDGVKKPVPGSAAVADVPKPKPAPAPKPAPKPAPTPPQPNPKLPVQPPNPRTDIAGLGKGLVFYAPFDEAAGSKVAWEYSGAGRHISTAGVKGGEAGQVGNSVKIDKKQLVSEVRPHTQLGKATVSFWIKNAGQNGPNNNGNLISVQNTLAISLQRSTVTANMDATGQGARTGLPQNPKWYHVLVENNGANSQFYVNGVKKGGAKEPLKKTGNIGAGVVIGSNVANYALDEVAIWNRTLSATERKEIYERGLRGTPILSPAKVIAHWKMDDPKNSRVFADSQKKYPLGSYSSWSPFDPITPDPVPLTLEKNESAARIWLLGEQPDSPGAFELKMESGFTFEGWFHAGNQKIATLGNTLSGEVKSGWRAALLRGNGQEGFAAFMYENGDKKIQALGSNLKIFDNRPHHFAAVWDPKVAADAGRLSIFIDNRQVGAAMLPHADIAKGPSNPFQVGSDQSEITVDELRFSATPLTPGLFLTAGRGDAGEDAPKPKPAPANPPAPAPPPPKAAAPPSPQPASSGEIVQFDFEGNSFDGWKVEGTAFGSRPAGVGLTGNKALSGQVGKQVVHSSHKADGPTGKLTSNPFKISRRYLRLLVAGGPHRGKTYVGLMIDGKLVHSTTGQENLDLREVLWDLSSFANKEAQLVVVDDFTGRWGMIACDHVVLTNDAGKLTPSKPSS